MRVGQGRALRGAERGRGGTTETCVCVCLHYEVATPRQLLNEQHVLGLTRDIFTVFRRPSSTFLSLLLLPMPALLHLLASSLAHIVALFLL